MAMKQVVGLRIDVDTGGGFTRGVIPLVRLLDHFRIKATFFIVTGQDLPLRGVPRMLSERGFTRRVLKLRTSLLKVAFGRARYTVQESINAIKQNGHELALHGFHHFAWQLHLKQWGKERVKKEMESGRRGFRLLTGAYPAAFASPGWDTSADYFNMLDSFGFSYASDTRGFSPFYPLVGGKCMKTLQIPVTLPTLDEFIALGQSSHILHMAMHDGDVYCAHAEFDGIEYLSLFEQFIEKSIDRGFTFVPLSTIADNARDVPEYPVEYRLIPGRSSLVTVQKKQGV